MLFGDLAQKTLYAGAAAHEPRWFVIASDSQSVMPADGSVTASDLKSVKGIELSKEILGTITAELDVKFLGGLLKRARYYG